MSVNASTHSKNIVKLAKCNGNDATNGYRRVNAKHKNQNSINLSLTNSTNNSSTHTIPNGNDRYDSVNESYASKSNKNTNSTMHEKTDNSKKKQKLFK